ncbi:MAG: hypothetical protein WAT17_01240 [Candidatus Saccharimonadales bacterium]|jgi:uncharacterized membrane protein
MKKSIKKVMLALMMVPLVALSVSNVAFAQGGLQGGADAAKGDNVASDLMGNGGVFQTVTNILLFIIGAVSVIMLIIGGIRYVVSGGDQSAVTAAKNTILYAIVGIVVAFLAYAAVNFVINQLAASA